MSPCREELSGSSSGDRRPPRGGADRHARAAGCRCLRPAIRTTRSKSGPLADVLDDLIAAPLEVTVPSRASCGVVEARRCWGGPRPHRRASRSRLCRVRRPTVRRSPWGCLWRSTPRGCRARSWPSSAGASPGSGSPPARRGYLQPSPTRWSSWGRRRRFPCTAGRCPTTRPPPAAGAGRGTVGSTPSPSPPGRRSRARARWPTDGCLNCAAGFVQAGRRLRGAGGGRGRGRVRDGRAGAAAP
jgi:hypothetical protein